MTKIIRKTLLLLAFAIVSCTNNLDVNSNKGQELQGQIDLISKQTVHQSILVDAIPHQTGFVNSLFQANTTVTGNYPDGIKVGKENVGFLNINYKTIFTFDTNGIPQNANINYVLLLVGIEIPDFPGNQYEYIFNRLVIELAHNNGFGGSHTITGLDYSAIPQVTFNTVIANAAVGGLMLNLDKNQNLRDLNPHINRNGKTQIRLSLNQPTESYLGEFYNLLIDDLGGKISLYIGWN